MSEFHDAFKDGAEEDPRTQLADVLRGFFLSAITEQALRDSQTDFSSLQKAKAGSLYKTDGGFLKIHLQVPAGDKIFHAFDQDDSKAVNAGVFPDIWVLIPFTVDDNEFAIEDVVVSADDIIMHTTVEGHESAEMWVRDDYIGPSDADSVLDVSDLFDNEDSSEQTEAHQQQIARSWIKLLEQYDLRTIATTAPTS